MSERVIFYVFFACNPFSSTTYMSFLWNNRQEQVTLWGGLFGILGVLAAIIFCRRRDQQSCDVCAICCFCCVKPSNKIQDVNHDKSNLINNSISHASHDHLQNQVTGNAIKASLETSTNGYVPPSTCHPNPDVFSRREDVSTLSSTFAANYSESPSSEYLLFDKKSINNKRKILADNFDDHQYSRKSSMFNSWDPNASGGISTSYLWHFKNLEGSLLRYSFKVDKQRNKTTFAIIFL